MPCEALYSDQSLAKRAPLSSHGHCKDLFYSRTQRPRVYFWSMQVSVCCHGAVSSDTGDHDFAGAACTLISADLSSDRQTGKLHSVLLFSAKHPVLVPYQAPVHHHCIMLAWNGSKRGVENKGELC